MAQTKKADKRPPKNTEECVETFLSGVMKPPKDEPRTQRAARDNEMLILGFNQAQEQLRDILAQTTGKTKAAERSVALAQVRTRGQIRPQRIGDLRVWIGA